MSVMPHDVLWHVTGRMEGGGREEGGKMRKMERPQRSICRLLISSMVRRVGVGVGGVGGFDLVGGNGRDVDLLGLVLNCVAAEDSGWGRRGGGGGTGATEGSQSHLAALFNVK